MRAPVIGAAVTWCCAVLLLSTAAPATAVAAPYPVTMPSSTVAELDPTVIYSFPASPIHVEPGRGWLLPVSVNASAGNRPALLQRQAGRRWVTVQRTRARGTRLRFPVTERRVGTFRYRIVLPSHGGFEARTSMVQVVHVSPVSAQTQQHFVPATISGTFTGYDVTWGQVTMSWSGSVTLSHLPPTVAGLSESAHYRPTALAVTWSVDYTDWRQCRFTGAGTLGLPDVRLVDGTLPDESVAPGASPSEYAFGLEHQWNAPLLVGSVACPGAPATRHEFTTSMQHLLTTDRGTEFVPSLRLAYVDGLPESGWVRFVGGTDPSDPSAAIGMNTWDLTGSGRVPFIQPAS